MATFALDPNDVLTARGDRPKPEKRVEKAVVKLIRGLSSATTTQFRTQVKLTPLACKKGELVVKEVEKPFFINSLLKSSIENRVIPHHSHNISLRVKLTRKSIERNNQHLRNSPIIGY